MAFTEEEKKPRTDYGYTSIGIKKTTKQKILSLSKDKNVDEWIDYVTSLYLFLKDDNKINIMFWKELKGDSFDDIHVNGAVAIRAFNKVYKYDTVNSDSEDKIK